MRSHRFTAPTIIMSMLAAFVFGAASPVHADYEVIVLNALDPDYDLAEVYIWDINDAGQACGTSTYQGYYSGFVWNTSAEETLVDITWPRGINDASKVVGGGVLFDAETASYTVIPGVSDWWYLARCQDINEQNVVVGFAESNESNSDGVNQVPLIWDPVSGTCTISVPAARELLRINESNLAVGNIRWSAGNSEAFVYSVETGTTVNLHELLSPNGLGVSSAADINDLGFVLGHGWNGEASLTFLWSEADGFTFLPGLDGGSTMYQHPRGINNHNQVVGWALNGSNQWRAFIWDEENGMRDLNTLADLPPGFILDRAMEITDSGWIAGDGHFGPGYGLPRGFVLRPQGVTSTAPDVPHPRVNIVAYPNPFNPQTTIAFVLPATGWVSLAIHDLAGGLIHELLVGELREAGAHSVVWYGNNAMGQPMASGTYLARLTTPWGIEVNKLILTK